MVTGVADCNANWSSRPVELASVLILWSFLAGSRYFLVFQARDNRDTFSMVSTVWICVNRSTFFFKSVALICGSTTRHSHGPEVLYLTIRLYRLRTSPRVNKINENKELQNGHYWTLTARHAISELQNMDFGTTKHVILAGGAPAWLLFSNVRQRVFTKSVLNKKCLPINRIPQMSFESLGVFRIV